MSSCEESVTPGDTGAGEEEVITTINIALTEDGNPANVVAGQWQDLDGDGGNAPVISGITLENGKTYSGTIELLNEPENEDITDEIRAEKEEHQFYYTAEGNVAGRVTITVTDVDANNLPVGLQYSVAVSAGAVTSGSLNIILYHFADIAKTGTNVSDETDIDIDIPITIN